MGLTAKHLNQYVGKNIKDICEFGFTSDEALHCAHFVSHVLNFRKGALCGSRKGKAPSGVCTSVQTILDAVPWFREFDQEQDLQHSMCLIFVAPLKNATGNQISGHRHVGFFANGAVWHYENETDKVITHSLFPSAPGKRFADRYKKKEGECGLWIGGVPSTGSTGDKISGPVFA